MVYVRGCVGVEVYVGGNLAEREEERWEDVCWRARPEM